ncbi:MAG: pirin family protein [Thiovulaceae bacterium]|nr:pirin family protein [Sulfurimonadaceae bacterium]
MQKRQLLKLLLLLPLSLIATTKTPFDLKRSHQRHRIKKHWMDMWQSFHYFDYDDREEMGYGVLRVLDDATIGTMDGTPIHPHKNMEILTIMLEGEIYHQDNLGNKGLLKAGEIQLMSAGSGLKHAETNPSRFDKAKALQIWISPKIPDCIPYYQHRHVPENLMHNRLYPIVSQTAEQASFAINQDALIYRGIFTKEKKIILKNRFQGNGFYIFVIKGELRINKTTLKARDALGLNNGKTLELICSNASDVLVFDIPMEGAFY